MILAARPPFHAAGLLAFLAHRAVPGVEEAFPGGYRRSLRLTHGAGVATLAPGRDGMRAELVLDDERDEPEALAKLRRLLDLDAPAEEIAARVTGIGFVAGTRVPGTVDGPELAVRAVLGQQISVRAASTHAARLTRLAGEPLAHPVGAVTHLFPTTNAIAALPDEAFAMPARRRETLRALAGASLERLIDLPGIGPWTQTYVNMRALGDRDAWLGTDLGVRHALARFDADPAGWRPFRAYAVVHLWSTLS